MNTKPIDKTHQDI